MKLNEIPMEEKIRFGQAINLAHHKFIAIDGNENIDYEDFKKEVWSTYGMLDDLWLDFVQTWEKQEKKYQEIEEESIPMTSIEPDETYAGDKIIGNEEEEAQEGWVGEED